MRIAVLGHTHYPIGQPYLGGLEAHTAEVTEELAALGHDVALFAKEGSTSASGSVEIIPVVRASFDWTEGPGARAEEAELDAAMTDACRRACAYDVVLNNSLSPVPYLRPPSAPMLTVLHTPADLERVRRVVSTPGWSPRPREEWVSVSESNARGWRRLLAPTPVDVVHNGIRLESWPYGANPEPYLAWSARITPEKGLHVAMEAAVALGRELRIAGPVSDPAYFRREIEPRLRRHAGLLRYVGHLDHPLLGRMLALAAAFVCTPLWEEPFGLAPLEAMACGTPVAALGRGAMPELLGDAGGRVAASESELPAAIQAALQLDRAGVRRRAESFSLRAMALDYVARMSNLAASAQKLAVDPIVLGAHGHPLAHPLGQ